MENGIQLYCVTHKRYADLPNNALVSPILVGMADVPEIEIKTRDYYPGMSVNNKNWNELEAIYYIHYNCDAKVKGQFQYSRRLNMSAVDINKVLKTKKFITAYGNLSPYTIQTQYCINHHIEDLVLCGDIIKKMYPDLYAAGWNFSMASNIFLLGNCFIAKAEDYDPYVEFLFSVLNQFNYIRGFNTMDAVEKHYSQYVYNYEGVPYQSRISEFLAERLFTFYIFAKYGNNLDSVHLQPLTVLDKGSN